MRAFVSVGCGGVEPRIEAVQQEFEGASGLDFVPPGDVHVTLSFLGDVDSEELPAVIDAIERGVGESDVSPFRVEFAGLGVFPSVEYIRVLWIGVREGSEELNRLHERIESGTTELGFEPDDHEFTPHATIARMRHAGGKELVQRKLDELDPTVATKRIEEVCLTESTLTENGPDYQTIEAFEL